MLRAVDAALQTVLLPRIGVGLDVIPVHANGGRTQEPCLDSAVIRVDALQLDGSFATSGGQEAAEPGQIELVIRAAFEVQQLDDRLHGACSEMFR